MATYCLRERKMKSQMKSGYVFVDCVHLFFHFNSRSFIFKYLFRNGNFLVVEEQGMAV